MAVDPINDCVAGTPQNRINTRRTARGDTGSGSGSGGGSGGGGSLQRPGGNGGAKETFTTIRYGNDHGAITFGKISKLGDVISDVFLQASEGTHQLSMDKDGPRKGFTSIVAPSNFQVDCGRDNKKEQDTVQIHAENGNIIITASSGKIEFNANDIEFNVKGESGKEGNFVVSASESIVFKDCKKFQVDSKTKMRMATPGSCEIVANEVMKIYGGVARGVSDGCSVKNDKNNNQSFQREQQKT